MILPFRPSMEFIGGSATSWLGVDEKLLMMTTGAPRAAAPMVP
jgi:hypothetical protein